MQQASPTIPRDGISGIPQVEEYRSVFNDDRTLSFSEKIDQLALKKGRIHAAKRISL